MRSSLRSAAWTVPTAAALLAFSLPAQVPNILLDTDFRADCDDAGALGVLHALADLDECTILGIGISDRDPWAPRGVDAINHFYGRPNLPIGSYQGGLVAEAFSYAGNLAHEFHNDHPVDTEVAFTMYRRLLAQQPDQSVKIVTTGYLTNLYDLLNSGPDAWSSMSGADLVAAKVQEVSMFAGGFPNYPAEFNTHDQGLWDESNFVIQELDRVGVDVTFVDFDIGDNILTGDVIRQHPDIHPVGRAYDEWLDFFELATGQPQPDRPAWDHCAVYYAVRGLDGIWTRITNGRNVITPNGNSWQSGQQSTHGYIRWLSRAAGEAYLLPVMRNLQQVLPAAGRNPYSTVETFADGTSGSIKRRAVDGRPQVDFGNLVVPAGTTAMVLTGRRPNDQTIIAEVEFDNTSGFSTLGFTFGVPAREAFFNSGPRVELVHTSGAPDLRLRLMGDQGGGNYGQLIVSDPIPGTAPLQPATLRIDVRNGQVRASVDGVEILAPTPVPLPTGLNYTHLRGSMSGGGARVGFVMVRQTSRGPGLSIDQDGTLWFSEIEPAAWDPFPGIGSAVLFDSLLIDGVTWKNALRSLGPAFAFESLGLGSHMIYGLRGVPWPTDLRILQVHNNEVDGMFVRR